MTRFIQLTMACVLFTAVNAASAMDEQVNSDFAVIAEYFSHFVYRVQKPFFLYHWRSNPDLVSSPEVQQNPQKFGRKIIESEAPGFISGLYVPFRTSGSLYGGGLYAALDPIITEGYGRGRPESWALLVTRIPIGFQMLDLRATLELNSAQQGRINQALANFKCWPFTHENYFLGIVHDSSIERECADLISRLLRTFNVDAFLYSYPATAFAECQSKADRNAAVVFTSSSWLSKTGADARVYTSRTSVDPEARLSIESQFLYMYSPGAMGTNFLYNLAYRAFQARYPQQASSATRWNAFQCQDSDCLLRISVQSPLGDVSAAITEADLKSFLFAKYPDRIPRLSGTQGPERLHWEDLYSTESTKNIGDWIKNNLLNCGTADFLAQPSTRSFAEGN